MGHNDKEATAKVVTVEEFLKYRRGGGGKGPENREPVLAALWKCWAHHLIDQKQVLFDKLEKLTPQQVVDRNKLRSEFMRVGQSANAARRYVLENSLLLNNPLVNTLKF